MTREEAIENLKWLLECSYVDSFEDAENEALDMAIHALEQEQSREFEDYENEIEDLHNRLDIAEYDKERLREEITNLETKIKALEQEPKTGHWIKSSIGGAKICSICQAHMGLSSFKFCPSCGARMEESEE